MSKDKLARIDAEAERLRHRRGRWRRIRLSWQPPCLINMHLRHGEMDQTCTQPGLGVFARSMLKKMCLCVCLYSLVCSQLLSVHSVNWRCFLTDNVSVYQGICDNLRHGGKEKREAVWVM